MMAQTRPTARRCVAIVEFPIVTSHRVIQLLGNVREHRGQACARLQLLQRVELLGVEVGDPVVRLALSLRRWSANDDGVFTNGLRRCTIIQDIALASVHVDWAVTVLTPPENVRGSDDSDEDNK